MTEQSEEAEVTQLRSDAHRFAAWVIEMASRQVPIVITTRDGVTTSGLVTEYLTARAAGAPKGDQWARFRIADRVISVAEITVAGYLPNEATS